MRAVDAGRPAAVRWRPTGRRRWCRRRWRWRPPPQRAGRPMWCGCAVGRHTSGGCCGALGSWEHAGDGARGCHSRKEQTSYSDVGVPPSANRLWSLVPAPSIHRHVAAVLVDASSTVRPAVVVTAPEPRRGNVPVVAPAGGRTWESRPCRAEHRRGRRHGDGGGGSAQQAKPGWPPTVLWVTT